MRENSTPYAVPNFTSRARSGFSLFELPVVSKWNRKAFTLVELPAVSKWKRNAFTLVELPAVSKWKRNAFTLVELPAVSKWKRNAFTLVELPAVSKWKRNAFTLVELPAVSKWKRNAFTLVELPAVSKWKRNAFTLVELLVVIGIIALLMAIVLSTTRKVRDAANSTQCLSNLRQIGLAISQYANDHRGCLVPGDYVGIIDGFTQAGAGSWADILVDGGYISAPTGAYPPDKLYADFPDGMEARPTILHCPAGVDENGSDNYPTSQTDPRGAFYFVRGSDTTHQAVFTWYAINTMPRLLGYDLTTDQRRPLPFNFLPDYVSGAADWSITRVARLKDKVPLIFDGVWCFNGDPARINARHGGGRYTNILFADGRCESQLTSTLPNNDWYLH